VPKDPNFPALDSAVYDPKAEGSIIDIQVTTSMDHPIAVIGLKRMQGWMKRNTPLANLRPSILHKHLPFIFIVPETQGGTGINSGHLGYFFFLVARIVD